MLSLVIENDVFCDCVLFGKSHCNLIMIFVEVSGSFITQYSIALKLFSSRCELRLSFINSYCKIYKLIIICNICVSAERSP